MGWKDVQDQLKIIEQFTQKAIDSTESDSELIQIHIALASKRLELIDDYINNECKDADILNAFQEYSKHTSHVLKTISEIS